MGIRLQLLLQIVFFLPAASATAQTITEFPLPSDACCPREITAGPDGSLWFGEAGSSTPRSRYTGSGPVSCRTDTPTVIERAASDGERPDGF